MKSVLFLFSLILAPYSSANFQTEVNIGVALQKLKESNDINIYGLTLEHFDKILLIKGPLAETAYLNKSSSWYLAGIDLEKTDTTIGILGRTQFINKNTYIELELNTNFKKSDSLQELSLNMGYYLDDYLRVSASTSFSKGNGWNEFILFCARKLFPLTNNQNIAFEYATAIEDEDFLEYQSATLTYYPVDFALLSLGISHNTKERKGTYIDFSTQYYFTTQFEISASFGYTNYDGVGDFWALSTSYRF
ncbi:putative porin [Pseudoalteromonas sp. NBT06-2]|uniref:putative porin n=1 Tax=Pseudoalteromonas sp. NBT06-2 TaxID=2025950 RepID=UPI00148234A5|nr:putative porin [Pseudoalteromonas sp. NBT06-2]